MYEPGVGPMPLAEAIKALEQEDPDRFPIRTTYIGDAVIACREAARNEGEWKEAHRIEMENAKRWQFLTNEANKEIARLKAERDEYRGALELCVSALYEAIEIAPLDRFPGKAGGAIQQSQYVLNRYGLYKALAGRKGE